MRMQMKESEMNVRKQDVLILDEILGGKVWIEIWADPDMLDIIQDVEGIAYAYKSMPTPYRALIDPRYDREQVKADVVEKIREATRVEDK